MRLVLIGISGYILAACAQGTQSNTQASCQAIARDMQPLVGQPTRQAYLYQAAHEAAFAQVPLAVQVTDQPASGGHPMVNIRTNQTGEIKTAYQILDAEISSIRCE